MRVMLKTRGGGGGYNFTKYTLLILPVLCFNFSNTNLPPLHLRLHFSILRKRIVRAMSQLLSILLVNECSLRCGPKMSTGFYSTDKVWGLFHYHPPWCSRLTWHLVQPEDSLKHVPEEEARGWERAEAAARSESVPGRMCRAPAELSIQSSLCWGQNGQEGGTSRGN